MKTTAPKKQPAPAPVPSPWWVVKYVQGVATILSQHPIKEDMDKDMAGRLQTLYSEGKDSEAVTLASGHMSKFTTGPAPSFPGKRGRKRGEQGKMTSEFTALLPEQSEQLKSLLATLQGAGARDPQGHKWSKSSLLGAMTRHCLAMNREQLLDILKPQAPK